MITREELLKLIGQAVEEDSSLETGATHWHPKALLIEVFPRKYERTEEQTDTELTEVRLRVDGLYRSDMNNRVALATQRAQKNAPTDAKEEDLERLIREALAQLALEKGPPAPQWADVRQQYVDLLPPLGETPAEAVERARALIVEALNSDHSPETVSAEVDANVNRFRLTMRDGSVWRGSVTAFADSYLNQVQSWWPERAADAPGEVFAVRVVRQ
jgi:hypothetical protein